MELVEKSTVFKEDNPALYYDIVKSIGSGGHGKIFLCKQKFKAREYKALKFILKTKSVKARINIKNEIALMSLCQHQNIIKYSDGYYFRDKFWIFMEYMDAGCLTSLIDSGYYRILSENSIAYVAHEILMGLRYLHSRHIIHRDVKSDNILLGLDGSLKLADFGYAA